MAYILAILASLVVALTVTPAMSFLMLGRRDLPDEDPPLVRWLRPRYERTLRGIEKPAARHLIASVMLALAGGLGVLPLFGGEFIPPLKRRPLHRAPVDDSRYRAGRGAARRPEA
jgi:Cu/Ag efflux pump CusA